MTPEMIAIAGWGLATIAGLARLWSIVQKSLGDVRREMSDLNGRIGRIEGILSVVVPKAPLGSSPDST